MGGEEAPAIGIDLGTTNSCAAVLKDGKIVLIHGDDGKNTTASVVFFDDNGARIVGNLATENTYKCIENGIFGTKRFIGRSFDDFKHEKCMSMFPYKIENDNGKPIIVVKNYKKEVKKYSPEQISAMILTKLVECANKIVGKKVTKAVLTVPAYFNGKQRQATIDAGKIAGLEVIRIINEPTAAILAFEIDNKYKNKSCNVLVYDFGGGTFDVTIANIHNGNIEIKASNSEHNLGGEDLTYNLIDYFIEDIKENSHIDPRKMPITYERLRRQAEKTKIILSSADEHKVQMDCIDENSEIDFDCRIARSIFQRININLFDKIVKCIKKTLKDAKMNKEDIDEILSVGGSTLIPYVTDLVKNYFNKEPNVSIHPEEAVAIGAARQAAISIAEMHNCEALCAVKLTDEDNQNNSKIDMYEGERDFAAENKHLLQSKLSGIRLGPKGTVKLDVIFNINENGILKVDAQEIRVNNSKQIEISIYSNNLSDNEMQNNIEDAENFKEADRIKKDLTIRNTLNDNGIYMHNNLKMILQNITNPTEKERAQKIFDEIADWLSKNENRTLADIKSKISVIEKFL